MIPYEDVDSRLAAIGKNRRWLTTQIQYKASSIREALAPNSTKRSTRLQRAITIAIEREEQRQSEAITDLRAQNLVISASPTQFRAWNSASLAAGKLLEDWARDGLDKAALEAKTYAALRVAETRS